MGVVGVTDLGTDVARPAGAVTLFSPQRLGEVKSPVRKSLDDHTVVSPGDPVLSPRVGIDVPRQRAERPLVLATDFAAGGLAGVVDWRLGLLAMAVVGPVTMLAGMHRRRFSLSVLDEAPRILRAGAWIVGAMVFAGLAAGISVGSAFAAGALTVTGLFAGRGLMYARIRTLRRSGRSVHPVVLVGPSSVDITRRIQHHPDMGLRVVGTADAHGQVQLVDGGIATISAALQRYGVRDVVLDPCGDEATMATWVRNLAWRDLSVHVVLPQVGATPVRGWDDHLWGVPLMRMQSSLRWRRMRSVKRLTDVVVAGGALLFLAPLLGVVALVVRREMGGDILFRQERVGLDGRTFEVFKFRSMRDLPPDEVSPWNVPASDRIGPVGRFIRKYSIDELPQLWNVLRGDMSLVGPRPERPEYVTQFSATYPHYESRHRAPVGLTGLAAVEGLRGNTSIEDRARFDNLYVDSWTFWTDLKILVRTVSSVLCGTGS